MGENKKYDMRTVLGEREDHDIPIDEKVCSLSASIDRRDLSALKTLVKNPGYICSTCGRAASNSDSLCSPEML